MFRSSGFHFSFGAMGKCFHALPQDWVIPAFDGALLLPNTLLFTTIIMGSASFL